MTLFLLSVPSLGGLRPFTERWVTKTPRVGGGHLARRRPDGPARAYLISTRACARAIPLESDMDLSV